MYDTKDGCYSDEHHRYWPAAHYRSGKAKEFVDLPENKVQLCRSVHNDLHAMRPPEKPSQDEMNIAIARSALRGLGETA